jgi:hypothetical protein
MTTPVNYPESSIVTETVVTKNLLALNDNTDLKIGATSDIGISVGGSNALTISHLNSLETDILIKANNTKPLEFYGSDPSGTVYVSTLEAITSTQNNTDTIISSTQDDTSKNIKLETQTLTVHKRSDGTGGHASMNGHVLANSAIVANKINMLHSNIGYGFSIEDGESLSLYKYDTNKPIRTVGLYGDGDINQSSNISNNNDDPYVSHSFPIFGGRGYKYNPTNPNENLVLSVNPDDKSTMWNIDSSNNIYYDSGNIGIGGSIRNINSAYSLQVVGTIKTNTDLFVNKLQNYINVSSSSGTNEATEAIPYTLTSPENLTNWGNNYVISSDGNTLVSSKYSYENRTGKAWVYEFVYDTWLLKCTLTMQYPVQNSDLGENICISRDGTTIAMSAKGIGKVFIFIRPSGGSWSTTPNDFHNILTIHESAILQTSDYQTGKITVVSMDASANTIIIGKDNATAYVFTKPQNGWTNAGILNETSSLTSDQATSTFGRNVIISKNSEVAIVSDASANAAFIYNDLYSNIQSHVFNHTINTSSPTTIASNSHFEFGRDFKINEDGNTLIVSLWKWDFNKGKTLVYEKENDVWTFKCTLKKSSLTSDEFGKFPSISGDGSTIVVASGYNLKRLFVFERPGSSWGTGTEEYSIPYRLQTTSSVTNNNLLIESTSISYDGSIILCGHPYYKNNNYQEGSVSMFIRPGTSWNSSTTIAQTRKLFPSKSEIDSRFGYICKISSDTSFIVVSAYLHDNGNEGTNTGTIYVFNKPTNGWNDSTENLYESANLSTSTISTQSWNGHNLEISKDGSTIISIASQDDTNQNDPSTPILNSGRVFLYKRPINNIWVNSDESAILDTSDESENDQIGCKNGSASISHDGKVISIGAPNKNYNKGKIYIWKSPTSGWSPGIYTETFSIDNDIINSFYGWNVQMNSNGTSIFVGIPYEGNRSIYDSSIKLYNIYWDTFDISNNSLLSINTTPIYQISDDASVIAISDASSNINVYSRDTNGLYESEPILLESSDTNGTISSIQMSSTGSIIIASRITSTSKGTIFIWKEQENGWESQNVESFFISEPETNQNCLFGSILSISEDGSRIHASAPKNTSFASGIIYIYDVSYSDDILNDDVVKLKGRIRFNDTVLFHELQSLDGTFIIKDNIIHGISKITTDTLNIDGSLNIIETLSSKTLQMHSTTFHNNTLSINNGTISSIQKIQDSTTNTTYFNGDGTINAPTFQTTDTIISNGAIVGEVFQDGSGVVIQNGSISANQIDVSGLKITSNQIIVSKDIVPNENTIYDIGTSNITVKDLFCESLYVDDQTFYIGDTSLSKDIDNKLKVFGGLDVIGTLSGSADTNDDDNSQTQDKDMYPMPDPTNEQSKGNVMSVNQSKFYVSNIYDKAPLGDFVAIYGPEGTDEDTELITGIYEFSSRHSWFLQGWWWIVYESSTILKPSSNGIDIDKSKMKTIAQGNNPKSITIHLDDVDIVNNYIYFVGYYENKPLEVTLVNDYIPSSYHFKRLAMVDYNKCMSSSGWSIVPKFVKMPSNANGNMFKDGTKSFIVTYIATNNSSVFKSNIVTGIEKYLISSNKNTRKTSHYVLDDITSTYSITSNSEGDDLFPKLSFGRWTNSVIGCNFLPTIYKTDIGWGSPPNPNDVYNSVGYEWLLELFKRTYIYIQYGYMQSIPIEDPNLKNIETLFNTHCVSHTDKNLRMIYTTIAGKNTLSYIQFHVNAFGWI